MNTLIKRIELRLEFKFRYFNILILFLCLLIAEPSANAMQTIFNVPSADVTPKGHLFLQQEVQSTPWWPDDAMFSTTYSAIGIGHNTEIDATLFNVGAPATENISVGVGFKSCIPIPGLAEKFPEREIKLTVGTNLLIGLEGNDVGNWTYTHISGRLPKLNTRLTAGVSYGTKQVFGMQTTSFIAGIEQPVTKKLTLLTDWFSGNEHWAGYMISGFSYAFPKNTTLYAGFQIPNSPMVGSPGFVIELAKIF